MRGEPSWGLSDAAVPICLCCLAHDTDSNSMTDQDARFLKVSREQIC